MKTAAQPIDVSLLRAMRFGGQLPSYAAVTNARIASFHGL